MIFFFLVVGLRHHPELGFSPGADLSPQLSTCSTSNKRYQHFLTGGNASLYRATLNFRGILYDLGPPQISGPDHSKSEKDAALQARGTLDTTAMFMFCSVKRTSLF